MSKSEALFLLVLALIPVQLNKFFFIEDSYVLGIPIDYRAIAIHLSDLAIIAFILATFSQNLKNFKKTLSRQKTIILIPALILFYFFINTIFISKTPWLSLWYCLKLTEFIFFFWAATLLISGKNVLENAIKVIAFSLIWQSTLIVLQFIFQKSVGFWFLGERSFDTSTVSIAHFEILGKQLLRPYGTFPHPNVAAAFVLVSLIYLQSSKNFKFFLKRPFLYLFSLSALVLTFSQSSLLAAVSSLAIMIKSARYKVLVVVATFFSLALIINAISNSQLVSVAERIVLAQAAFEIIKNHFFFGVGALNFIQELAGKSVTSIDQIRLLQPVHNVFVLIMVENGFFGLLLFIAFLITVARHITTGAKLAIFVSILIFTSLDHFLWTLQQGQMVFWLACAYIVGYKR